MTVSSSTNKVSYAGNSSTKNFAYTFKIFDEDDLTVIIRAANGTETVKTITTDYTVSGVGSAGGGYVTMVVAPATGQTLFIIREQDLVQELDIVPNDPFPAETVESALDKLTFMVQQHQETLNRTIKASKTNTISKTEFTESAASRASKLLAFDTSGDLTIGQELGTYRGNWAASTVYNQRDIIKDGGNGNLYFCNTAHTSTGALPISTNADVAKWDLLLDVSAFTSLYDQFDDRYLGSKSSDPSVDNDGNTLLDGALYWNTTSNRMKVYDLGGTTWKFTAPSPAEQANIDALGPIAADVSTVAGISADVTAVAGDATDIGIVAGIAADVSAVAAIDSDVTAVAADATDIGTVAADLSGSNTIGTVAGIAANVTTVAGISADVTAVAADATDIGTVAGNIANVNTVAGISADVTTVAGISADVTAVAGDATDIGTVATNIANVNTVAGISADVTTVAADGADIGTVATNIANVNTVAGISADVTTVAGISADVTAVVADATDIGTVAADIADVSTVAGISADVTTVAGISADVTTLAGISADITALAADFTTFFPTFGEILHPVNKPFPTGWYDTTQRLLSGVSERAILSNSIAWNYQAGNIAPDLVFDPVNTIYVVDGKQVAGLSSLVTHTRASTATYVDSSGVLQTASSGVARVGHHVWDGSAWVNEGLLHESEARTNLMVRSEEINLWNQTNIVNTANAVASPTGAINADKIAKSATTTVGQVYKAATVSAGAVTISFYAKAAEYDTVQFTFFNSTDGHITRANIDLNDGSISGTITGTVSTEYAGDGWWRVFGTGTVVTVASSNFYIYPKDASSYLGDGTSGIYVWGAQVEQAPTPSSYIPTSGATATRAADVLTIPTANLPWPTPVVIGSELVTNGTFDADISGWTASFGLADISWVLGVIRVKANSTGIAARVADQVITGLTTGKVYQFSGNIVAQSGTGTNSRIEIRTGDNATSVTLVQLGANQTGPISGSFVATGTSQVVRLRWDGNAVTTDYSFDFDNVSVREINPLAVSIQMDGRATYADEGAADQQKFFQWVKDGSNFVQSVLDTDVGTGRARTQQAASGVFDGALVSSNDFTPDIFAPFSIASRHGSTFIQLAVDGTAGSANITPVALPDLSATNLQLGFDYNGTIRTFRVWANDIGDTGIAGASA